MHQHHTGFTENARAPVAIRLVVIAMNGWLKLFLTLAVLECWISPVDPDLLLKILYDSNKNFRLKGVDMCPEELALAKTRLPDGFVDLFQLKHKI